MTNEEIINALLFIRSPKIVFVSKDSPLLSEHNTQGFVFTPTVRLKSGRIALIGTEIGFRQLSPYDLKDFVNAIVSITKEREVFVPSPTVEL